MLRSLQGLRGVAALLVLLFHVDLILKKGEYLGVAAFGGVFSSGFVGVDIFFVLSGFIILRAHRSDLGHPGKLAHYAYRRWSRVYPIYWLYLTGVVVLMAIGIGSFPEQPSLSSFFSAYSLVRTSEAAPPLSVAWSLYHEVLFYAMFAILIVNRRIGIGLIAGWFIIIPLAYATGLVPPYEQHQSTFGVLFSLFNLNFALGMLACSLCSRIKVETAGVVALVGIALIVVLSGYGWVATAPAEIRFGYALASFLIILGLAARDAAGSKGPPAWLLYLGNASYSIYLVHTPVLSMLMKIIRATGLGGRLPPELIFILVTVIALAISCIAYQVFERPLLAWLGRRKVESKPATA